MFVFLTILGIALWWGGWMYLGAKALDVFDYDRVKSWLLGIAAFLVLTVPIAGFITQDIKDNAKPFDGYVYKKTFYPAHTSMVLVGKVFVNQYVPARWNIVLKHDDDARSCDVSESVYNDLELGQDYHCGGY